MGALHKGHLSLIKQSIKSCNHTIVSIFVNNRQFSPDEDFEKYPRSLEEDKMALKSLNVDILFLPESGEIYPKNYSTYIEENKLAIGLESSSRPHFFKGVLTVVLKLFNIVQPDVVFFGKKDIQQLRLVQKMILDLNLEIDVISGETIREKNGLAMSSRNKYLSQQTFSDLEILYSSLVGARKMIKNGEKTSQIIQAVIKKNLLKLLNLEIDYIEITDSKNLKKIDIIDGDVIISLAVIVEGVRLIDNIEISL